MKILALTGKLWLAVLCARYCLHACRLQNDDRFVPKPLRFKCSRILSLFCVICARLLKGLQLFVGFACCQRYGTVSAALPLCKLQICNGSSVTHQKKTRNISSFFGAADRTRTDTVSPPRDFKSLASAIPPQRHRKFVCRIFRQTTKMIVARRTVFVNNYRLTFGRFVISSFFSGLRR